MLPTKHVAVMGAEDFRAHRIMPQWYAAMNRLFPLRADIPDAEWLGLVQDRAEQEADILEAEALARAAARSDAMAES
jgi:hypothetical protein